MVFLKLIKITGVLAMLLLLAYSCTNDKKCNDFMYSPLQLRFYKVTEKDGLIFVKDSALAKIVVNIDNLTDTLIKSSTLYLPLSPLVDSLAFELELNSNPADIVYIKYKRNRLFINYECGFRYDFTLDTLVSTQGQFDSIKIVKPYVTVNNEEHIKIFLHSADGISN